MNNRKGGGQIVDGSTSETSDGVLPVAAAVKFSRRAAAATRGVCMLIETLWPRSIRQEPLAAFGDTAARAYDWLWSRERRGRM